MKELDRRREPETTKIIISTGSIVRAALVVIVIFALFLIRDLLMVFLASIVIASAVEPAAAFAKRHKIPRVISILSIYLVTALLFASVFYLLFVPLIDEFAAFVRAFPEYSRAIALDSAFSGTFGTSVFGSVSKAISVPDLLDHLNILVQSFSTNAFGGASFIFGGVVSFLLMIILSFYLAVQEDGVGKFLRIITPWKQERYVVDLWRRSQAKIGLWMQGQLILAVLIALLTYLGLTIIGVPQALLLAVAAGLLEIIPLFGPIIASIPAILIGFAHGGASEVIVIALLFLAIHQLENQVVYPLVVKKVVGVPPMVSIIALLVGFSLGGFLGMLISVPAATVFMEFINDLEEEKALQLNSIERSQQNG